MRDWSLGPGDPLVLTLAADFRFCTPDYINDHIWELETGNGDPPALSLYTTYGLRVRRMRLFPRFTLGSQSVSDPASFFLPPRLRSFFTNYLSLDFSPFANLDMTAEFWVPDSHSTAGRFTVANHSGETKKLMLELCGQLTPLEGESIAPLSLHSVNILAGRCADLAPVVFLTGGPQPGPGPYPSLALDLAISGGGSHTLTWAQAALENPTGSFEYARSIAARHWEAERAKIEIVNASQTIEVRTGDPDWDAAFALTQKTAFGLFFGSSQNLPNPSFVHTRQPDQGFSPRGDGSDYPHLWSGQSILETVWLAGQLPGSPGLAAGLVRNFLANQSKDGAIDGKPGVAGQRGHWLAAPLLANLAWETFQLNRDLNFLREIQPGLEAFIDCWFDRTHDRDGDGFPEWDMPLQTGLEDNPAFNVWQSDAQGADISTSESPALAAMLFKETQALGLIAEALNQPEKRKKWEKESERISNLTEECWDADEPIYHLRDRDTHLSPKGKLLGSRRGAGTLVLGRKFRQPMRLLIRLELIGDATRRPEVNLDGQNEETPQSETLERKDFHWGAGLAVATTRLVYTSVSEIAINGLEKRDRVSISVMDFSKEDITLFLPLWAGIPDINHAMELVRRTILATNRFGGKFGIPDCNETPVPPQGNATLVSARGKKNSGSEWTATPPSQKPVPSCYTVHLPWNALIGEGILKYGLRQEAAVLTTRLMTAVIQNLKQEHAFAHAYHVANGAAIGERNSIQGFAPLGLFLGTLGVRIESTPGKSGSSHRVILSGKNPFPWPVTVKYRGLTITRNTNETVITFPDGQTVKLDDPTDAVVSVAPVPLRDTR
ncbi:MAG: hypothetical protein ABSG01_01125 [Anaerolineales bacterium]|jgi:hypothetical protein